MTDGIIDAARDAVLDITTTYLLDSVHDRVTPELRDWLAAYLEWQRLGRHLLRTADHLTNDAA